ncbi:MAG: PA0069 family radical SAM protein [Chitinophagales bacterium]
MEDKGKNIIKGRGAQINTGNKFHKAQLEKYYDDFATEEEKQKYANENLATQFIKVYPKSILNKPKSPDIPVGFSMNPYQGCEHGCVYCYARNSHEYWDYSGGLDFEQKILYKPNAPQLLEEKLKSKNWKASSIMLAGNTDCYQPIERKMGITRNILEVFYKYRHPVGIITKNALITRDIDILQKMAQDNLIVVSFSLTTLNQELKSKLEPRTASVRNALRTIKQLSDAGIPVNVMMAPIIPALNSPEILKLVKTVSEHGALSVGYTMVRLNGMLGQLFEDWIRKHYPMKADNVLNKIRECHNGQLNDSRYGVRMSGDGNIAQIIADQFQLARQKYLKGKERLPLNYNLYQQYKTGQRELF